MNYVEWLRVRNLLRNVAIVLAILVVLAVILRVSVSRYMTPDGWIEHFQSHPGVKVSRSVLPDGTKRMAIDDPAEQTHAVIDDHGYAGKHIVVTEPSSKAHEENAHFSVGSMHVAESRNGTMTTTTIDTNGSVPMIYYMALADVMALIVATILAAPFAREIDGHLEIALMKPVSRERYAIGTIVADAAGILGASLLTIVAFYLCQLLFESPRLDFSGVNAKAIAMGAACPLAWYAMLCAATTWLNRAYGAVLGFAWPVTILIGVLTRIHPGNVVALFIHDVAWALSRLIPLSYVWFAVPDQIGTANFTAPNFEARFSLVMLFFVIYAAFAIWQWRRVEA
jgi:hypothetical protein